MEATTNFEKDMTVLPDAVAELLDPASDKPVAIVRRQDDDVAVVLTGTVGSVALLAEIPLDGPDVLALIPFHLRHRRLRISVSPFQTKSMRTRSDGSFLTKSAAVKEQTSSFAVTTVPTPMRQRAKLCWHGCTHFSVLKPARTGRLLGLGEVSHVRGLPRNAMFPPRTAPSS